MSHPGTCTTGTHFVAVTLLWSVPDTDAVAKMPFSQSRETINMLQTFRQRSVIVEGAQILKM